MGEKMNIIKKCISVFFMVFLICGSAFAQAQVPAPAVPETGGFFANLAGVTTQIIKKATGGANDAIFQIGIDISKTLIIPALAIAGSLALIILMYEMIQAMASNKSILQPLFDIGIPCAFTAYLIKNYEDVLIQFKPVLDLFRNLGGTDPIISIMTLYGSVFSAVTIAIRSAQNNLLQQTLGVFSSGPSNFLSSAIDIFVTVIFAFIIIVVVMLSLADVLGLLFMGPFLFAVGVAFGPLLIAGLVTPWTREYFTKWIQFIVASAALTGVVGVIFTIATKMFNTFGASSYSEGQPTAVSLIILAIMLMSVNSLITQAPSIASALIPGSIGSKSTGGDILNKGFNAAKNSLGGNSKNKSGGNSTAKIVKKLAAPTP